MIIQPRVVSIRDTCDLDLFCMSAGAGLTWNSRVRRQPMVACDNAGQQPRRWTHIPRKIPVTTNPTSGPLADESSGLDFSEPDLAASRISRILWKHFKGTDPPWSAYHFCSRGKDKATGPSRGRDEGAELC